jgi:pyroglutamyl-peptidase
VNILIAAFRPFGARKTNTSEEVLKYLRQQPRADREIGMHFAVLPVNFRTTWSALKKAIAHHSPDALLLLGEAGVITPTIENTARNRRRYKNSEIRIEKNGRAAIQTSFNARKLAAAATGKSAPQKQYWRVSQNAGNYLCNFSYWKALAHKPELPCIFVHVSALDPGQDARSIAVIAKQTIRFISAIKMELHSVQNKLSAQKQLTVPGQKAGRAKRKKGA